MYKLISHIPGVSVRLTPNPLNAKIELTESAKRELALVIAMDELNEEVYTAYYYAEGSKNSGKNVDGVFVPNEADPEKAAAELKYWHRKWFALDKDDKETLPENVPLASADRWLADKRVQMWLAELDTEHVGDCTAVACSCTRCHVENLLGINTLPGGKMDNHRVAGLYWEEFATPEQKEAKRKSNEEFRLKYPSKPWTPDEATKERWAREEVMAAEAWAAHKKAYKDQQDSLGL